MDYLMTKPGVGQAFTEFYILGLKGKAENYLHQLHLGEEGKVVAGIVNYQHKGFDYRLEVIMEGNKLSELGPIRLNPKEQWEGVEGFTSAKIGDGQKIEFLLYEGEQLREIRYLWVDVRA